MTIKALKVGSKHNSKLYVLLTTSAVACVLASCSLDSYIECEDILNDAGQKTSHLNANGFCVRNTDTECGRDSLDCTTSEYGEFGKCVDGKCIQGCMDHAESIDGQCICNEADNFDPSPLDNRCVCKLGFHMNQTGNCVENTPNQCGPRYNFPYNAQSIKNCNNGSEGNTSICGDDGQCIFQCDATKNYELIVDDTQPNSLDRYSCVNNIIETQEDGRTYYDCKAKGGERSPWDCLGPAGKACSDNRKGSGLCICPDGFITINDNGKLVKAACIGDAQDFYEFELYNAGFQTTDPRWNSENNVDNAFILLADIIFDYNALLSREKSVWVGIGWSEGFSGKFYGNGKIINTGYLYCNSKTYTHCGLFSKLKDALVKDLNIETNIISDGYNASVAVGGLAGKIEGNTLIDNCNVTGSVQAAFNKAYQTSNNDNRSFENVGGIVGMMSGSEAGRAKVQNTTAAVAVYCDSSDNGNFGTELHPINCGGLIGYAIQTDLINIRYETDQSRRTECISKNCSTKCADDAFNKDKCFWNDQKDIYSVSGSVGGIAGYISDSSISNATVNAVYAPVFSKTGLIQCMTSNTNTSIVGGIAGTAVDTTITNASVSLNSSDPDEKFPELLYGETVGGIVGKYIGNDSEKSQISDSYFWGKVQAYPANKTSGTIGGVVAKLENNLTLNNSASILKASGIFDYFGGFISNVSISDDTASVIINNSLSIQNVSGYSSDMLSASFGDTSFNQDNAKQVKLNCSYVMGKHSGGESYIMPDACSSTNYPSLYIWKDLYTSSTDCGEFANGKCNSERFAEEQLFNNPSALTDSLNNCSQTQQIPTNWKNYNDVLIPGFEACSEESDNVGKLCDTMTIPLPESINPPTKQSS